MRPAALIFVPALLSVASVHGGPEQCRQTLASYNDLVAAIRAAIRDYERCVMASIGRDECGVEFIELQVTHRNFEAAVLAHGARCDGGSDAR